MDDEDYRSAGKSFAEQRLLISQTLQDLKEAVDGLRKSHMAHEVEIAVLKTKIAIYSGAVAIGVSILTQLAMMFLKSAGA